MSMPNGGDDLNGLLSAMSQLQANLADAETGVNTREVTGGAGGGAVSVTASGEFSFTQIHIDPAVVDPSDVALLEDLILVAVRDACSKLVELRKLAMGGAVSQALGGLLGGFEMPGATTVEVPPEVEGT